ncbi:MAG: D-alanyl-D-alanine carboxypeptidase family protein [Oscillospiraceae bacterium]|nr:D-alanyl-D-alanine carboxypeptidase family protein [Oscillospiraceae bacterium]
MSRYLIALLSAGLLICGCNREAIDLNPNQSSSSEISQPAKPSESQSPISSSSELSMSSQSEPAAELDDWRLMLVNFAHPLADGWSVDLAMTRYGYEVDARITDAVDELVTAASNDGVSLIICYGYRTIEQSRQLFEKQVNKQLSLGLSQEDAVIEARRWVAPPGTSEHHTGLALDIVTPSHQVLNHAFANTDAGIWMAAHSWEYGFVIRYPEDKQDITGITYEPWHVRYVGKEHAAAMHESGECLEEYVSRLSGN